MREHPSSHQLKLYQRRALAPDLFLTVDKHIRDCPSCSEQCQTTPVLKQDYENLLAALMPDPDDEPYHLTSAELAGYTAGSLDVVDTESAESHLSVCAQCAEAARELRAGATPGRRRRRPLRQVVAQFITPVKAWSRPALFASLILLALGIGLTTLLIKRVWYDRPSLPVADQAASANLNANQSETAPPQEGSGGQNAGGTKQAEEPDEIVADEDRGGQGAGSDIESDDTINAMLSPSSRRAITSALAGQRLEASPVLAQLRGEDGSLRGGTGNGRPFRLLSPVAKVVETAGPTFRWAPLAGTSSYIVTVADERLNKVAESGPLTKTEWRLQTPLTRGRVYSWQVTAIKDGQSITSPVLPAPQAKFMILDETRSEELRRVRGAAPRYHLGLGVLYARAGLLDEAESEFRALLNANPGSVTARKLLQNVRSMKR